MLTVRSLRVKVLLWALIPLAIVLTLVAVFGLDAYERQARDVVQGRDTELARISAARLSEGLSRYSGILQSIAAEEDVRSLEPSRLSSVLERSESQLHVFDAGVTVYNGEGVALWSQPTAARQPGTDFPATSEFDRVRTTLRPVFSDVFVDAISGEYAILIAVPVGGSGNEFKGALVGIATLKYSLLSAMYAEILELKTGYSRYAYLVDGAGRVIYHRHALLLGTELADSVPVTRVTRGETGAVLSEDSTGESVVSGFAPVPGTDWGLITQEHWADVVEPIRGYSRLLLALLVGGGVISGAFIFFRVGNSLRPLKELTRGARRIAGGDFDYRIASRTGDELENLAQQFNTMAGALKESYSNLEEKIEERTLAERRRADQLRTINEVGRSISSILSLDELLPFVASSIQETFGYYNVNILLIDQASGDLHLRASAGVHKEATPIGIEVKAGRGIIGWVAQSGESRVANDVSLDPTYYAIEELADTKAELAVPIRAGGEILGVLAIESTQLNAFDEMDVFTAETLADQLAVAIRNTQLYEQAGELATVHERQRLARDLHDAVTQTLFSASIIADVLPRLWEKSPADGQQRLEELRQLTRGALAEMRMLLLELRPAALTEAALGDLLRQLTQAVMAKSRLPITLTVDGQCPMPPDVQVALYRIAQESLNNMVKHARASQAGINLNCQPGHVELVVSDDGSGFDPNNVSPDHLGLGIMRERAETIGARLEIDSQVGHGTKISVVWAEASEKE